MFLVDAAGLNPSIEVVATHHEQAAVIAAEYYARISGKTGVALVTTGPGASNAVTGIAGAWLDSIPILILAGQVKTTDYNFMGELRQSGPQELDLCSMVTKITKYRKVCSDPQTTVSDLENAVAAANSGRPGPAVLEIPLDIQSKLVPIQEKFLPPVLNSTTPTDSKVYETAITEILLDLKASSKPLLIVGGGIKAAKVVEETRDLVSTLSIPCALTWRTADFLEFENQLNAGRFGNVAKRYSNILIQKADFILVLGSRLDATQTAHNLTKFGKNAKIVMVDVDNAELRKAPDRFTKWNFDLRGFIPEILKRVNKIGGLESYKNWSKEILRLKTNFQDEQFYAEKNKKGQISIYQAVDAFSEIFEGNEIIITGSSGLAIEVFHTHFKNKKGQQIHLTTALGAMGYGLPGLLGASETTSKKTILLESDGSLMMNIQELQSIKTRRKKIVIFVLNNHGYASIRATQRNYFDGHLVATNSQSGLDIPVIEKIANCFDFKFVRVKQAEELKHIIRHALNSNSQIICEIDLQRDEKLMPKCGVLKSDDNSLTSAPLEDMAPLLSLSELGSLMGDKIDEVSIQMRKSNFTNK